MLWRSVENRKPHIYLFSGNYGLFDQVALKLFFDEFFGQELNSFFKTNDKNKSYFSRIFISKKTSPLQT
jgi:hypothetical protein